MTAFPRIDYLTAEGWGITGHRRGAEIWSRREFDVLGSPGDDTADAGVRLRDPFVCVADADERTPRSVARDMVFPESDVVRYRVTLPGFTAISPGAGLRAVRELVTSCARATADDLPDTDTRTPDQLVERTPPSTADEGLVFDLLIPVHHEAAPPFDLAFHWAAALLADQGDALLRFPGDFGAKVRARREKAVTVATRGAVQGRVTRLAHDGAPRVVTIRGPLTPDGHPTGRERAVRVRVDDRRTYLAAVETTGAKHGIVVGPAGSTVVERGRG